MHEQAQDLRELMVIRKACNPNPVISTKSMLMFSATWLLWLLTVYLIAKDYRTLLYGTIVGTWTLADLAKAAAAVLLAQLNLLLVWSVCISHKRRH